MDFFLVVDRYLVALFRIFVGGLQSWLGRLWTILLRLDIYLNEAISGANDKVYW